ncbi:MAG: MlaD family protein [Verrucomicrobiota bacterium]|jgi:phospholipid/cholesterol/gamma-HCH transport system substrate-binding protein|nr:MlaD family protein [Verrucomicrobiota bacterium]MDP7048242.1 MlaD family protein [Verrucomicrobiota bacterium]
MRAKTEWKVGLFLTISLVLAAALVINFSKGTNPFTETYTIHLKTKNVDGIVKNAVVMMAGVPVGKISAITLDTDNYTVTLDAKIKAEHQIRADAKFFIETAGFLGDKYIGVIPGANKLPPLKNGDDVVCQESFDLVRTARSATDLIDELKIVATQITNIVKRIDSKLLDEHTLTNLAAGLSNLREISAKTTDTIANVDRLITTNTPPIQDAVNNVVAFSEQLKAAGGDMQSLVATNRVVIDESLDNIRQTTESLRNLVASAERGEGLAGKLFNDEELASNLSSLSSNLVEVSTKLNKGGLWGILFRDKTKEQDDAKSTKPRPAGGRNRR